MSNITPQGELKAIQAQIVLNKEIVNELHKEFSELESLSNIKKQGSNIAYRKMTIIRSMEPRQIEAMNAGNAKTQEIIHKFEGLAALTRAEISVIKRGLIIEEKEEHGIKNAFLMNGKEIKIYEENLKREETRKNLLNHSLIIIKKRMREVLLEQLLKKGMDRQKAEIAANYFDKGMHSRDPKVMSYFYTEAPKLLQNDRVLLEKCAKDFKILLFKAETRKKLEVSLIEVLQQQLQILEGLNIFLNKLNNVEKRFLPDDKRKILSTINALYTGTANLATGGLFKKEHDILENLNKNIFMSENEQNKIISEEEEEGHLVVHLAQILNKSVARMIAARHEALAAYINQGEIKKILASAPFGSQNVNSALAKTDALLKNAGENILDQTDALLKNAGL